MRRKDKEITDVNQMLDIIKQCKICRIAMSKDNIPYIVPLNYGYQFIDNQLEFYFHSAKVGKKVDYFQANNNVCIEIDCDFDLIAGEKACDYTSAFKSIIGFGEIEIVEDFRAKKDGLNIIMQHQTGNPKVYDFSEKQLQPVLIYKLKVNSFSGKQFLK